MRTMMRTSYSLRRAAILLSLMAMIVACSADTANPNEPTTTSASTPATTAPSGEGGGHLTVTLGNEPSTLDPQARDEGPIRFVNSNIFETLLIRSADGTELIPLLATELPTVVDDLTWHVTVRDGVTFHNGEKLDAAAVAYSINRIIDPTYASSLTFVYGPITGATAVDDTTVEITTSAPDPVLPARLAWIHIVPPEGSKAPDFAEAPVGTGPYTFVEWLRGEKIELTRNEDYWGEKPAILSGTFNFATDAGTRISQLLAGETDIITGLTPSDIETVPNYASVKGTGSSWIQLNAIEGLTADVRVREALNLALDKESIINNLYSGFGAPTAHPMPDVIPGADLDLKPYPYDPERATALIEEAGAVGGEIEVISLAGRYLLGEELLQVIADSWNAVGLKATTSMLDITAYVDQLHGADPRPQALHLIHSNELKDADATLQAYFRAGAEGSSNDNAELAALIDEGAVELDPDRRIEIYQEAFDLIYNQYLGVIIMASEEIWGTSDRVTWTPRIDENIVFSEVQLSDS